MANTLDEFNQNIASLMQKATPADLVQLLSDEKSLLRLMHNNVNNNRDANMTAGSALKSATTLDMSLLDAGGTPNAKLADNNINNNKT